MNQLKPVIQIILVAGLLFFTLVANSQKQNFEKGYVLSKCEGDIPEDLKIKTLQKIKNDVEEDDSKSKDLKINKKFYEQYRYSQNKILTGGKILFGDEMSLYVNKVANNLLEKSGNESLKSKLNFYVLKSDVVNAICMADGSIFITVGLLSQIESEAQLAFVISHEITHYLKKHSLKSYRETLKLKKDLRRYSISLDDAMKTLSSYSKESELESDEEGFKMFVKAGYDSEEATKMLLVLQYSHLPFDEIQFDSTFFNREHYNIPSGYFTKESLISSIEDNSDIDDTYSSQPNIKSRVSKLEGKEESSGVKHYFSEEEFSYINQKARFENQYIHLIEKNFIRAIYESFLLKKKFPNNKYLDECIAKALYGVSKINTIHGNSDDLSEDIKEGNMLQLKKIFSIKMKDLELNILALKMLKELNDDSYTPFIEDLIFDLVKELEFNYNDFVFAMKEQKDTVGVNKKQKFKLLSEEEYRELTKVEKINYNRKKTSYLASKDSTASVKNPDYYKTAFFDYAQDTSFKNMFKEVNESDDVRYFSELSYSTQRKLNKKRKKKTYKFKKQEIDSILIISPNYALYTKKNEVDIEKSLKSQESLSNCLEKISSSSDVVYKNLNIKNIAQMSTDELNDIFTLNEWKNEMNESYDLKMVSLTQTRANEVFDRLGYDKIMFSGVYSKNISNEKYLRYVFFFPFSFTFIPVLPFSAVHFLSPRFDTYKYVNVINREGYIVFRKVLKSDDRPNLKLDEMFIQDCLNQIVKPKKK